MKINHEARDFKILIQIFETFTHNCEKTVDRIETLTGASEREPRDLDCIVL